MSDNPKVPPFEIEKEKLKKARSVKPIPFEKPVYFTHNGNLYCGQNFSGCGYFYNRKYELEKEETSTDNFPREFVNVLKNVWDVHIPYGKFLDGVIFQYDWENATWKLVFVRHSRKEIMINEFEYDGDDEFILNCIKN